MIIRETLSVLSRTSSYMSKSFSSSTAPFLLKTGQEVSILHFSDLNTSAYQAAALRAIGEINKITSTTPGITWEERGYTEDIQANAFKQTLLMAHVPSLERFVGYAFFEKNDRQSAYCAWAAIHPDFRENGVATQLKFAIFEPRHNVKILTGLINKTNEKNLRVLESFGKKSGFSIKVRSASEDQVFYTIRVLDNKTGV